MNTKLSSTSAIIIGLVIGGLSQASAQISNGSFEDLNGATNPNPSTTNYNSIIPTPWTNGTGTADWFLPNPTPSTNANWELSEGVGASPDGGAFVSARWHSTTSESFSQTISGLTPGATYQVSFYQTNAGNGDATTWDYTGDGWWDVDMFGTTQSSSVRAFEGIGNQTWTGDVLSFTANSASTTVQFNAQGNAGEYANMGLDGVVVSQVPEPSAALLGALSALMFGLRRRR